MYELNKQEEKFLKIIVKNTRIDYYRKNQYVFNEFELKEDILNSNDKIDKEVENKIDGEIQAERLEMIFSDEKLIKIARALTYNEKLVLFLYYVEERTDEEIAKVLLITRSAVNKKRLRAIEKIKNEAKKRGIL